MPFSKMYMYIAPQGNQLVSYIIMVISNTHVLNTSKLHDTFNMAHYYA